MRHLLACLAILAASSAAAQSTMPYNPDADDDSYIGASDILGLLPLYGQQFGIDSSLTCDYDGTPFEDFLGDVFEGNVIIDSVLIQYHCFATMDVYFPSCPETYPDTVSYERALMLHPSSGGPSERRFSSGFLGHMRLLIFSFAEASGAFGWTMFDNEVEATGLDVFLGHRGASATNSEFGLDWYLPFPEEYDFSEVGLSFDAWTGFLNSATFCTILPYWHDAE